MPPLTLSEFADKLSEVMPAIFREYMRSTPQTVRSSGITPPQFMILSSLDKNGESRMTDLARALGVSTAAVTGIVDRLVRDGCIVRRSDPKDRRIVKVGLTAKATRMVKEMMEHRKKLTMRIFGMISQREREEYLKILMHVREHLK
jgi:DNA-binding MarR family transcriptional regulator